MSTIQARINMIFGALNTNANAFGKRHGLNIPTLYNIVNGERSPSFETLAEICKAEPQISAEYLLRGEGKPLRNPILLSTTVIAQIKQLQDDVNNIFETKKLELEE